jgi:hypothetical protein
VDTARRLRSRFFNQANLAGRSPLFSDDMDDNAPKENPPAEFNKLDLSQLQGFSFGTQWTQEKPSAPEHGERGPGGERPRRDERREGGGGFDRRDRRSFRRPAGPGGGGSGGPREGGGGESGSGGRREHFDGPRPRPGGGEFRGGPRREGGPGPGGPGERGPRQGYGYSGRGGPVERGPYESPYYAVTFYPEDTSFNTLVQTIRKSCRTVELFEIARTVVAKTDRFVVVVTHRPQNVAPAPGSAGEASPEEPKTPKPVFHISVPDGIPFESDEAAVAHVLARHVDRFFSIAEVEVDPPKGNFQVINKCGVTGALLGPPNYHRYSQIVQQHYAAKVGARMSYETYRSRIETVRDPEVVNQWLAQMKKTTRYTWKLGGGAAAATPAPAAERTAPDGEAGTAAEGQTEATAAPAAPPAPTFDTLEEARIFLLTRARDKVVRTAETARFHGKDAETMPPGEIRRAIEGALERQRRFPLDTANALRGRLRREHFTIFKKGAKGVSYVCAVKRKFRIPGQTFADSIGALIAFIEANPMVRASELASKFLGLPGPAAPKPVAPAEPPAPAPAEAMVAAPAADAPPVARSPESAMEAAPASPAPEGAAEAAPTAAPPPAPEPAKTEPVLSIEDRAKLSRLQGDLLWLVREGYVTEFIDGRLFAPAPMVEARKKEIEAEEHDPENFPEAPAAAETEAAGETARTPPPEEGDAVASELAPAASPELVAVAPVPEVAAETSESTGPVGEPAETVVAGAVAPVEPSTIPLPPPAAVEHLPPQEPALPAAPENAAPTPPAESTEKSMAPPPAPAKS